MVSAKVHVNLVLDYCKLQELCHPEKSKKTVKSQRGCQGINSMNIFEMNKNLHD